MLLELVQYPQAQVAQLQLQVVQYPQAQVAQLQHHHLVLFQHPWLYDEAGHSRLLYHRARQDYSLCLHHLYRHRRHHRVLEMHHHRLQILETYHRHRHRWRKHPRSR